MIRVNALTKFLVDIVEEREKNTEPNIYEVFTQSADEMGKAETMTPERLQELTEKFLKESLVESVQQVITNVGLLLVELKNQNDMVDLGLGKIDMPKLVELASKVSPEFDFLVGICKAASEEVDYEYVAERMVEVGRATAEARQNNDE